MCGPPPTNNDFAVTLGVDPNDPNPKKTVPSTPLFAEAVEALGALRPVPMESAWTTSGPLVRLVRAAASTEWGRALIDDPVAAREQRDRQARLAGKQTLVEASQRVREQKEADKRRRWRGKRRHDCIVRVKTALRRIAGYS